MAATEVITGARTAFVWNDTAVGFSTGISGEENIQYDPVEILNQLEVAEHTPVRYTCSFNASLFRRLGIHARNQPANGVNQSIMPQFRDILNTDGVNAVARVDTGDEDIYTFIDAKCSSRSFDTPVTGQVVESLAFVAIRLQNDSETEPNA